MSPVRAALITFGTHLRSHLGHPSGCRIRLSHSRRPHSSWKRDYAPGAVFGNRSVCTVIGQQIKLDLRRARDPRAMIREIGQLLDATSEVEDSDDDGGAQPTSS